MRFVVDDDEVFRVRQLIQDFAGVCLVGFCAALIHRPFLLELFFRVPSERVPIADDDFGLAQLLAQA